MQLTKKAIVLLLAIVTVAAAPELLAQFPGGGFPGGMRGGARNRPDNSAREQRPVPREDLSDRIELRLEQLRGDLGLAPEQQGAWKSYADRITAYADDISRERDRVQSDAPANSLAQIDRAVDLARNHLTALEDIAAAAKTLYGTLTAEQKKTADSRLASLIPAAGGGPAFSPDRAASQRNSR